MEAGKRIITDVFNRARQLQIPFFQRAYVWERQNWERFFDDMIRTANTHRPYFLGSVIQKQSRTTSDSTVGDVRIVIDGQQRLTTLCLFFRTLYDARKEGPRFDEMFTTYNGNRILQHNHIDEPVFEAVLSGKLTPELREQYSSSNVMAAHLYFESRREELAEVNPLHLFQRVYFVGIDLGPDEDEQQIFDTINSLGVALSTAELLKNELFGRDDLDLYRSTWQRIFEPDGGEERDYWTDMVTAGRSRREMIDLFLHCFLVARVGRDDVRVEQLFEEYKSYLKEDVLDRTTFVREVCASAEQFRANIRVDVLDEELGSEALDRLNVVLFGLNTTTVLPYVLYILSSVTSDDERARIFGLIESYLIRRVICRETTKNYNKVFAGFIRAKLNTYEALAARLIDATDPGIRIPTDQAVVDAFHSANLHNRQAKVVLYMLELSIRDDRRHSTTLSGFNHYSLEHLMPKKWRNHWNNPPLLEQDARERDQILKKLGNLSLLSSSLNSSIRDTAWKTKKGGNTHGHGLERFASGLETLQEELKNEEWDEDAIRSRGGRLAILALTVWPVPQIPCWSDMGAIK